MKIENVYIKPDGQIYACTVPVPPEPKRDRRHGQTTEFHFKIEYNKYRDALKACKDSSVRFEDQFSATILLHASLKIEPPRKAVNEELKEHVKNDTFYPIQCSIQIVEQKRYRMSYHKNDWTDWTCEVPDWVIPSIEYETRKVARLIPEAKTPALDEVFKNIPKGKYDQHYKGTAPIVEESQEELFRQVIEIFNGQHSVYGRPDYKMLKEKFTIITRKP